MLQMQKFLIISKQHQTTEQVKHALNLDKSYGYKCLFMGLSCFMLF